MNPQLASGLQSLQSASLEQLRDASFVKGVLELIGLAYDPRDLYGGDTCFMNPMADGLYQVPSQLADFLVWLSPRQITSYVEVGTWSGWTAAVTATYLRRFEPSLKALAVDPHPRDSAEATLAEAGVDLLRGQSSHLNGGSYDLVVIDGDHNYPVVRADWDHLGRHARVCAFHDVNDHWVCADPSMNGSVPRLWAELKTLHPHVEFLQHRASKSLMGIGALLVRP